MPLYPEQASNFAPNVDALFVYITAVCLFFAVAVTIAVVFFFFKYRRKTAGEVGVPIHGDMRLEVIWLVVPLLLALTMFAGGAVIYVDFRRPPMDTLDIYVVGKQWMWKLEHLEGQREINELHIPVGRAVRLTMTSEDVIHSFFVPAFRTKQDAVPGRYTTTWFTPTKAGKYHLFCAEYCGTNHSRMGGWVYVMEPRDYEAWLSGGTSGGSLAENGQKLFDELACGNCHKPDGSGRCPSLTGLFGKTVQLAGGATVKADEGYIRESILQPQAKIVAGYGPIMPTFQGLVTEEGVMQLIEYIKSLGPPPALPR